jgi:hypothetical protein
VDTKILQQIVGVSTIDRIPIWNNEITLPTPAIGDIIFGLAMIYDHAESYVFFEATCSLSEDKSKVLFDPADNLNYKYAVVSYLTLL